MTRVPWSVAVLVVATLLTACAGAVGSGPPPTSAPDQGSGSSDSDGAWVRGRVTDVATTEPVTENCVDEADPDGDGSVSSDDPPVCDPDPDTHGTLTVRGVVQGQGDRQPVAVHVDKSVPLRDTDDAPVNWTDIEEGTKVAVWITGEVMESYPPQVRATRLIVEGVAADEGLTGSTGEPPNATLELPNDSVPLDLFTYCWEGNGGGVCADGVPSEEAPTAVARRGEKAQVAFAEAQPESVEMEARRLSAPGGERKLEINQAGEVVLDLPPGEWQLTLSTLWPQGDAHYATTIRIRR